MDENLANRKRIRRRKTKRGPLRRVSDLVEANQNPKINRKFKTKKQPLQIFSDLVESNQNTNKIRERKTKKRPKRRVSDLLETNKNIKNICKRKTRQLPLANLVEADLVEALCLFINAEGNQNTEKIRECNEKTTITIVSDLVETNKKKRPLRRVSNLVEDNQNTNKIRKRKTKKRPLRRIPSYIRKDKTLLKFWQKRFQLFSRFNLGIKLDKESWYSVTPEKIAKNIADRMSDCDIVIDGFCGSGGNCIQLAIKCKKVIAIDIDPIKIEMAKHNAKIYNVDKNIEFIIGDFLKLCKILKADGLFLSPPWGGPEYKKHKVYDIEKFLQPLPATELMECCRNITENIALYIPRNSDQKQIMKLAGLGKHTEIEENYEYNRLVALTCYYGNLIKNKN